MDHLTKGKHRLADIKGIKYIDECGKFMENAPRIPIAMLDTIPWPDIRMTDDYSNYPLLPILTGRGCPYGCTFCYEGANAKKVRCNSVPSVMNEIERNLKKNPNIRYVNFSDDTFTLDKDRVLQICEGLAQLRERYDFIWFASAHIQNIYQHPELIQAMARSGLKKVFFGIESGDDRILQLYNKKITNAMIQKAIASCFDAGVQSVSGNIIIGGPEETRKTIEASQELIDTLVDRFPGQFETSFFTFIPYPNTPITNHPEQFGMKLLVDKFECFMEDIPLAVTNELNFEDILSLRHETNRHLQRKMRSLYENSQICDETILETYRLSNHYGFYTRWMPYVYKTYAMDDAYWSMRARGMYRPSKMIQGGFEDWHPVRTFELWQHLSSENGQHRLQGNLLSDFEYHIMKLCNGKLKTRELLQALYALTPEMRRCNESSEDAVSLLRATLEKMEVKKWILYARH